MQNAPTFTQVPNAMDDEELEAPAELAPESATTILVRRLTGAIGAIFLLLALIAWFARQGHYRLVLAFLIVALFASILHAYTMDNGSEV